MKSLYEELKPAELTLRDRLAIERTALSNERTLLSYVRTMIGLVAIGGTLLKLFNDWLLVMTGWLCLIFGMTVLVIGFMRYIHMYLFIYHLEQTELEEHLKKDPLRFFLWKFAKKFNFR